MEKKKKKVGQFLSYQKFKSQEYLSKVSFVQKNIIILLFYLKFAWTCVKWNAQFLEES